MMLGLQGNTTSPKVHRCVACSATFSALASLLVHQASHASAISKLAAPNQFSINPQEIFQHRKDSPGLPSGPLPPSIDGPPASFFICDCGEEFQDFTLMLEHKRSHISPSQVQQTTNDDNSFQASKGKGEVSLPTHEESFNLSVTESVLCDDGGCSTSTMPMIEPPASTGQKGDASIMDGISTAITHQHKQTPVQDLKEKRLEMKSTVNPLPEVDHDASLQQHTISVLSSTQGKRFSRKNSLMKMLASAYMKQLHPLHAQNQKSETVFAKQEAIPVAISPETHTEMSSIKDLPVAHLKRLLTKPGVKTKSLSIGLILESSKKRVVSLTKTFSPVVLLETRQKLTDPNDNDNEGNYQCGRCRRVFENLDKLTEHHFLHKKERIKCCRRCKQLIIGKLPFTDNHVCPQSVGKAGNQPNSFPLTKKLEPFHCLNHTRKLFFCPLCKHSYSRRYNLKTHKCHGHRVSVAQHTQSSSQRALFLRSNLKANSGTIITDETQISKSIAVGTHGTGTIKEEENRQNAEQCEISDSVWSTPGDSLLPYSPKSSSEQHKSLTVSRATPLQEEEGSWDMAADNDDEDEGHWIIPLDDEIEMLSSTGQADKEGTVKHEYTETAQTSLRFFVRDGIKRYPCSRCQKTYSRQSTLRRHLRLCGFRPHGLMTTASISKSAVIPLNSNNTRPLFDCFVCGKTFNRKDNMMVHRKRCQLQRMQVGMESATAKRRNLQPTLSRSTSESQTKEDDDGNWGIMSLPSVLPRRVTCECGVGFTSPRLLLEHLQKHAQESYTCPTCGETVNSWADYEVHLQIHMHPHNQLLKGLQPQRSQPLLLRFRQQSPQHSSTPTARLGSPQRMSSPVLLLNAEKSRQRVTCMRCGNTFSGRCSLRKHLSLNRCKGGRVANPAKNYHCSHCSTNFPNSTSLIFHQRSGACKPPIKPVRCPLCVRWFGTVQDLQKHLLAHKQSESYRCDVCQGTYPTLKSLKNHRRRIHRILVGSHLPNAEQLTP